MEKKAPATTQETSEPKESSTEGTGEIKETSGPVTEATEEAETQTSLTDKIMGVAAPVTAVAAAAGAAVVGFVSSGPTTDDTSKSDGETAPIPGTFPDTPVVEKLDSIEQVNASDDNPVLGSVDSTTATGDFSAALAADAKENTPPTHIPSSTDTANKGDSFNILPVPSATAPKGTLPLAETTFKPADTDSELVKEKPDLIDQVKATDDEPVPGAVVPSIPGKVDESAETKVFGTGAEATAAGGFAAALAADAKANSPPTHIPSSSQVEAAPDTTNKGDSFNILPVPSATAPEGTKPLAETTFAKPADIGSLVPEPVKDKALPPKTEPETTAFEPVTGKTNVLSSGTTTEPVTVTDAGEDKLTEVLENGKTQPPATPEKPAKMTTTTEEKGPATPAKDVPAKTPVSQSSASVSKESKRVSGVPSEAGTTESGKKKKKGGFLKRLRKALS